VRRKQRGVVRLRKGSATECHYLGVRRIQQNIPQFVMLHPAK